jgi:hypothetical protein
VSQNNGLDATQIVTESTREANESFLSDWMFAEEAKKERQVETEPTRDTAMDESLLSDRSFFAEEIEHEQHIPSITAAEDC